MESPNTLVWTSVLRRAVYQMDGEGDIWTRKWPILSDQPTHDEVVINLSTLLPALEGAIEYDCNPVITLSWLETEFAFAYLLGRTIRIPRSYDDFVGEHVATLYCLEHLDFDDVTITFLERDRGRYHITVTGRSPEFRSEDDDIAHIEVDTIVRFVERMGGPIDVD